MPVDPAPAVSEINEPPSAGKPVSPMAVRVYRISEQSPASLKAAATRDRISTKDALYALICCLITRVRVQSGILSNRPGVNIHIVVTNDTRKHLGLHKEQIGNMVYLTVAGLPISTVLGSAGLIEAAAKVRTAVDSVNPNSIAGMAQVLGGMPTLGRPEPAVFARN